MSDIPDWIDDNHRIIIRAVGELIRWGLPRTKAGKSCPGMFSCPHGVPMPILSCCYHRLNGGNPVTAVSYLAHRGILRVADSSWMPRASFRRPLDGEEVVCELKELPDGWAWWKVSVREAEDSFDTKTHERLDKPTFWPVSSILLRGRLVDGQLDVEIVGGSPIKAVDLTEAGWAVFNAMEKTAPTGPAHERLVIRRSRSADDVAILGGVEYRLPSAAHANLLEALKNTAGEIMQTGSLSKQLGGES